MGSFTFAPTGLARNNKLPNEDSQDLELDSTNLFAANRFPGIDRIESGAHVAYGVKSGYYLDSGGYATTLIGQSRRLNGPDIFPTGSGLNAPASDYVGSLDVYPGKYVNLGYQTRLDPNSFASRLHEVNMSFQPDPKVPNVYGVNYIFLSKIPSISEGQNRNSLNPFITQKLSQYWSTTAAVSTRLGSESRIQQVYTTTTYQGRLPDLPDTGIARSDQFGGRADRHIDFLPYRAEDAWLLPEPERRGRFKPADPPRHYDIGGVVSNTISPSTGTPLSWRGVMRSQIVMAKPVSVATSSIYDCECDTRFVSLTM